MCSVSVIKVGNIIIGVSGITLRCIVSDAQVVKARQEDQDPNDEDRHGSIRVLKKTKQHRLTDRQHELQAKNDLCRNLGDSKVSSQEQRADGDEDGADEEEDGGQGDGFIGHFGRTLLKLGRRTNIKPTIMDIGTPQRDTSLRGFYIIL